MKVYSFTVLVALPLLLVGCLGQHSQSSLETIQGELVKLSYVEAYIEYGGPQERWSGPSTFTVHVLAKEKDMAEISVTPAMYNNSKMGESAPEPNVVNRAPASSSTKGISAEAARDHFGALANAMQEGDEEFRGCLYPVRVRLIRSDGGLLDKQACRSTKGWPYLASQMVDIFLTSAYGKTSVK